MAKAPQGKFRLAGSSVKHLQWFKASGEFRAPRKGEYYLSGAIVAVWQALQDYTPQSKYWIAVQCSAPVNFGLNDATLQVLKDVVQELNEFSDEHDGRYAIDVLTQRKLEYLVSLAERVTK